MISKLPLFMIKTNDFFLLITGDTIIYQSNLITIVYKFWVASCVLAFEN